MSLKIDARCACPNRRFQLLETFFLRKIKRLHLHVPVILQRHNRKRGCLHQLPQGLLCHFFPWEHRQMQVNDARSGKLRAPDGSRRLPQIRFLDHRRKKRRRSLRQFSVHFIFLRTTLRQPALLCRK